MRSSVFIFAVALGLSLVACAGDPEPRVPSASTPADATVAASGNERGAPEPKPLKGVEDVTLEGREKRIFADLVGQMLAPCASEAVPLRQCVEEHRSCAACLPAARLLGQKIHEGAGADEARRVFALRFGPDVKKIDVADSPARGPANAPVTIVVWSDFECPHCKHAMPYLDRAVGKFAPNVRLVHKFYPLRQHSHAEQAARAAIAAQNQGRYWEMEHVLFDHQNEQSDTDLAGYAADLKLDMRRWTLDLSADRTNKILERDHDDTEKAGLSGTPFILINGREFDGTLFHVATDLDAWITLEIDLAKR